MTQADLFDVSPRYPDYPGYVQQDTSQQAAADLAPKLGRLQALVLSHFKSAHNGLTDEELMRVASLGPNTARPRRCELMHKGLIADSGRKRKTISGKDAVVWVAI